MSKFTVMAYCQDPMQQCNAVELDSVTVEKICIDTCNRESVKKIATECHKSGYWVEVFADDGELLAGPLDPDEPAPAYIV